jgi:hypothetical protein
MDGSVLGDWHTTAQPLAVWFVFQAVCASMWTRCVRHIAGAWGKNEYRLDLLTLTRDGDRVGGGGHADPVKSVCLFQCMTFFPLTAICYVFHL